MYRNYKIIGMCISKINDQQVFEIIETISNIIKKLGYKLFIYHTCTDLYYDYTSDIGDKKIFEFINYDIIDALIIFDEYFYDKELLNSIYEKARIANVPTLSIGGNHVDSINIVFENDKGFERVVRHVIEMHNIKDVYHLAGLKGNDESDKRELVFKKVLNDNKIEFSDNMIGYGEFWSGPTIKLMKELLKRDKLPKAFICANDIMAITVCSILEENGFNVPNDIVVTGFDAISEAEYSVPRITTSGFSKVTMGQKIKEVLIKLIEGISVSEYNYIECEEIYAESCGCVKKTKKVNTGNLIKMLNDDFNRFQYEQKRMYLISTEVMTCRNTKDLYDRVKSFWLNNTTIIIDEDCLDEKIDPLEISNKNCIDKDLFLLLDTDNPNFEGPRKFSRTDILPDIEDKLSSGNPLVFNSINYIGNGIGYVCFNMIPTIDNYRAIPQYVAAINNTIGGYRNVIHQRYMKKKIAKLNDIINKYENKYEHCKTLDGK